MPHLIREGVRLEFEECGAGEAVILHHALTSDRSAWQANGVAQTLSATGFRCVLVDAVGHGDSEDAQDTARSSLAARVADVIAIADRLSISRFGFVGYSMGAWVGTGLLAKHPMRISHLVLAGWDPLEGARLFTDRVNEQERRREFLELAGLLTADAPVSARRLSGYADTYMELFRNVPAFPIRAKDVERILLACGIEDPYFENAKRAASMSGAKFQPLAGDHLQAFRSPDLARIICSWLSDEP